MFDWDEYIQIGEQYLNKENECLQRIGVSRVYYGLYNLAKRKTPSATWERLQHSKTSHVEMWNTFFYNDSDERFLKEIHLLKQARQNADYDSSTFKFKKSLVDFKKYYKEIEEEIKSRPNMI